jgi:hypothetical protein
MYLGWGRGEACKGFFLEKPEGKRPLGDPGVDGRSIILRWIFQM